MGSDTMVRPFRWIEEHAGVREVDIKFHSGQGKAWNSERRVIAILCGTQWGKTEFGQHWLKREIEQRGAGDYLIGTSTFKLLQNKLLPDFLKVFRDLYQLGEFSQSRMVFDVSKAGEYRLWGQEQTEPTRVLIFSGQSPEGAEAATAKAAWLDEAGQEDFKEQTFEAIERRVAIHQGRILITTTLYNFGWLKRRIYDPWLKGDQSIDVIQSDSVINPAFPREEWERARATLPAWKFDLFYRGRYSRPAGAVYDCFDTATHCRQRFPIDPDWPRYVGHDFGPANMAALWLAENPSTHDLFIYRAYLGGSRSIGEHVVEWDRLMVKGEKERIIKRIGGAPRIEDGWREAFRQHGWPISPPGPKVEKPDQQILRVYELFKKPKLFVFDDLTGVIDDIVGLSYKLDDEQKPTDKIENDASSHYAACLRYIGSDFTPETVPVYSGPGVPVPFGPRGEASAGRLLIRDGKIMQGKPLSFGPRGS